MSEWIIKLSGVYNSDKYKPVYRAGINGDPGRTYIRKFAKRYWTKKAAKSALTQIRNKYGRPFVDARIYKF